MTPLRLAVLALVAPLVLAACDSAPLGPPPEAEPHVEHGGDLLPTLVDLRVPLLGAPAGDFLYTLGPLPTGGVFRARLDLAGGGAAELQSTGTPTGAALALALGGLDPDSVTVAYLAHGAPVAPPLTYGRVPAAARTTCAAPPRYEAGTAGSEPDSYHYKEVDGRIVVVKDYEEAALERARVAPGAEFVTARGERVRVTHVAFTVHGAAPGAAEAVTFGGPSAFALDWFDLAD